MLFRWLVQHVILYQSADQPAYRKGFGAADHLPTGTSDSPRTRGSTTILCGWVDFEKAFNTAESDASWKVLEEQGPPCHYIDLLQFPYCDQLASVQTGGRYEIPAVLHRRKSQARRSYQCIVVHCRDEEALESWIKNAQIAAWLPLALASVLLSGHGMVAAIACAIISIQ